MTWDASRASVGFGSDGVDAVGRGSVTWTRFSARIDDVGRSKRDRCRRLIASAAPPLSHAAAAAASFPFAVPSVLRLPVPPHNRRRRLLLLLSVSITSATSSPLHRRPITIPVASVYLTCVGLPHPPPSSNTDSESRTPKDFWS